MLSRAELIKRLCWQDRLLHNNSKVRYDANIDLKFLCDSVTDPKDRRICEFGSLFKETVSDSDVLVQDKVLDALIAYLKAADALVAGRYAREICDAIVANSLMDQPETESKAQIVFMLWVELEAVDAVLDAMEKAIKPQVAKAILPAVDVMFQAVSEFGSKIVPPNRLLKMLLEIYDHQDQNVRASSKRLTLELCHWIGRDHVKSMLFEKISDTMKKELDAELANVTVAAKPTRKIRSEQVKEPEKEVATDATISGPSDESPAEKTNQLQKMSLSDSQEQNKKHKQHTGSESVSQEQNKKRKHHTGSKYGFRHFVKSVWGEDVLTDDEEDLETLKEELKWTESHECTSCGLIYDMSCVCQQELEINMEEMQPCLFNYVGYQPYEILERGPDPAPWCPPWE